MGLFDKTPNEEKEAKKLEKKKEKEAKKKAREEEIRLKEEEKRKRWAEQRKAKEEAKQKAKEEEKAEKEREERCTKYEYTGGIIFVDEKEKAFKDEGSLKWYSMSEVRNFELKTEQEMITKKKKGGLGRAVVGGVVAGPAGAIVGGVTGKKKSKTNVIEKYKVVISLNDLDTPTFIVPFDKDYQMANKFLLALEILSKPQQEQTNTDSYLG